MKKLLALSLVLCFLFSLVACSNGNTTEEENEWPFSDIPAWGNLENMGWGIYGEGEKETTYKIYVSGDEDTRAQWIADLKKAGFKGYDSEEETQYYGGEYAIFLNDYEQETTNYEILVYPDNQYDTGFPEEIQNLFPEYNGDGMPLHTFSEDYGEEGIYYHFNIAGESEEGLMRYTEALTKDGFSPEGEVTPTSGSYVKETEDGAVRFILDDDFWYSYNDENNTGIACVTLVIPA